MPSRVHETNTAVPKARQPSASRRRSRRYRDRLEHPWCGEATKRSAFALPDTDAELVVHLHIGPETDVLIEGVDDIFKLLLNAGARLSRLRSTLPLAAVRAFRDPFGNDLVILEQSRGLATDADGRVVGVKSQLDTDQ